MDLKILAKKAVLGFLRGKTTKEGMGLTNAEYLALNRERLKKKKEEGRMWDADLFLFICMKVLFEYHEDCEKIIKSDRKALINAGNQYEMEVYYELSKIDSFIALCMVFAGTYISRNKLSADTEITLKIYLETLKLSAATDIQRAIAENIIEV